MVAAMLGKEGGGGSDARDGRTGRGEEINERERGKSDSGTNNMR